MGEENEASVQEVKSANNRSFRKRKRRDKVFLNLFLKCWENVPQFQDRCFQIAGVVELSMMNYNK